MGECQPVPPGQIEGLGAFFSLGENGLLQFGCRSVQPDFEQDVGCSVCAFKGQAKPPTPRSKAPACKRIATPSTVTILTVPKLQGPYGRRYTSAVVEFVPDSSTRDALDIIRASNSTTSTDLAAAEYALPRLDDCVGGVEPLRTISSFWVSSPTNDCSDVDPNTPEDALVEQRLSAVSLGVGGGTGMPGDETYQEAVCAQCGPQKSSANSAVPQQQYCKGEISETRPGREREVVFAIGCTSDSCAASVCEHSYSTPQDAFRCYQQATYATHPSGYVTGPEGLSTCTPVLLDQDPVLATGSDGTVEAVVAVVCILLLIGGLMTAKRVRDGLGRCLGRCVAGMAAPFKGLPSACKNLVGKLTKRMLRVLSRFHPSPSNFKRKPFPAFFIALFAMPLHASHLVYRGWLFACFCRNRHYMQRSLVRLLYFLDGLPRHVERRGLPLCQL